MAYLQKKIAEGVFFGGLGAIIIKIFAALGYVLILRRLSLHDYGVFTLLVSLAAPASAVILFSFDRIFVSQFALAFSEGKFSRMKGLYLDYYRIAIVLAIFFFGLAYLFRELIAERYNLYLTRYFWILAFFTLTQLFMNMVS